MARVDVELVRRGLARSRGDAGQLIAAGRVRLDGSRVVRASVAVEPERVLVVEPDAQDPGYASRAGHKLAGALDVWRSQGLAVAGRRCLDAGASTGGFTDVLLRRGAASVVAVDVGHGQLRPELRSDPRVDVREGVNVRDLVAGDVQPPPELVVADLSFISLRLVVAPLSAVAAPGADLVLLVKPQFEVGRERLGSGGVVRSPALRRDAVLGVLEAADAADLTPVDLLRSVLPGPSGNVEYLMRLVAPGAAGRVEPMPVGRVDSVVLEEDA
ncbi:TlyA family RNA methyltransferase [Cellulomonas sp. NTE-D12]|uniref:TlyA family RNA methyltransferase n=1 Tax=Cellulomonas sp. NTE-D12 TaxID=2962632 RepID=UPI00308788AE|nr:TlyA family rRNA (cytidine-2'-O)-methyltransferase [Cellulomonas sp. NTE-D12]